jgi:hypothetical protein
VTRKPDNSELSQKKKKKKSLSHVCSAVKTLSNCMSRYYCQVHEDPYPELLKRTAHNAQCVNLAVLV